MNKSKLLVNLVSVLIVAVAAVIGYRMWQEQSAPDATDAFHPPEQAEPEQAPAPPTPDEPPSAPEKPDANKAKRQVVLRELAGKFEQTLATPPSDERDATLRALSDEAVGKLGPSAELIGFIQFLAAAGAMEERERMLSNGSGRLFSGPHAKAARTWLPTLADKSLRVRLSRSAGEVFEPDGFREYFEKFGEAADHNSQAALLYGYCTAMARKDPVEAIRVYKELGYPKRIDNSGMASVMAALPSDADFPSFAKEIREDDLSLAKRARKALLHNWAGSHPRQAAEYIMNPGTNAVHPDQMAVVVNQWVAQDPEAAGTWLAQAPEGAARDEGLAAMARLLAENSPAKAWAFVTKITTPEIRRRTADMVAMEWRRSDQDAANSAMKRLPNSGANAP